MKLREINRRHWMKNTPTDRLAKIFKASLFFGIIGVMYTFAYFDITAERATEWDKANKERMMKTHEKLLEAVKKTSEKGDVGENQTMPFSGSSK